MPRRSHFPALRRYNPTDQGVVTVRLTDGSRKDIYPGVWPPGGKSSPARVEAEYQRIIGVLAANGGRYPGPNPAAPTADTATAAEVIAAFKRHAETYYRRPDGSPPSEVSDYAASLRPVRELYGHTPARDFGPVALRAVRDRMIAAGLSRGVINQRVGRIKRAFRWAAAEQLVPIAVFQRLAALPGLRGGGVGPGDGAGRAGARGRLPGHAPPPATDPAGHGRTGA